MEDSGKTKFFKFLLRMQDSTDYLRIGDLKDRYSYKIYANNAYVGVWVRNQNAFLISRYKVGPRPRLFFENHWDTKGPYGTVKPLELIEKCPFEIKEEYDDNEEEEMLNYLDKLEENNPIVSNYNSLQNRRLSAISFEQRLAGKRRTT